MSVCIGVSECTGGPGLFSLGAGTPQTLLTLQLPHMGGLVTTDGTPTLWSHEVPAPSPQPRPHLQVQERRAEGTLPSSAFLMHLPGNLVHRLTPVHTRVHTQNLLPSGRAAHTHILSGCTVCDNDRVCGATAPVWACAGDVTTRPRGSQLQGRWKPQSLRFLETNGAVSLCGKEQLSPACSALTPTASGLGSHRPIAAGREGGRGHGAETGERA